MLCEKCGVREARCIVTSCNGVECYEHHFCLECREGGGGGLPSCDQQQAIVESAMESARDKGLDEEMICEAIGIDAEEIRRIVRGEGVSDSAVWQMIAKNIRMD